MTLIAIREILEKNNVPTDLWRLIIGYLLPSKSWATHLYTGVLRELNTFQFLYGNDQWNIRDSVLEVNRMSMYSHFGLQSTRHLLVLHELAHTYNHVSIPSRDMCNVYNIVHNVS